MRVTVNGIKTVVKPGKMLPALREAGFKVPSVCFHQDVEHSGGRCRVCVCKVNGRIVTPCNTPIQEGMDIVTVSDDLTHDRAAAFSLIPHSEKSQTAVMMTDTEELEKLTKHIPKLPGEGTNTQGMSYTALPFNPDGKNYVISHPDKCVHCGLCVQMCSQVQGLNAISDMRKPTSKPHGDEEQGGVHPFKNNALFLSECVSCGQCINVCPYGALEEVPEVDVVDALLKDETKVKVIQIAPAVRVALAEEFGAPPGTKAVTLEMVTALRRFVKNTQIYDTGFSADLTIVEEGAELLERLRRSLTNTRKFAPDDDHYEKSLPQITSCSPGWVLFAEKNYHDLLPNLSTCKSPQQMHGAMTKHYWAQKNGLDPKDVTTISIMPCVAKKVEKDRPEFSTNGIKDVDHVLTTREFAKLLKKNNVNVLECEPGEFDITLGLSTGAGTIFGITGGVMEAALRTAYHIVTGRDVPFDKLAITPVRGMDGVRCRSIPIRDVLPEWSFLEGVDLKVAIAHGIANARKLMDVIRERKNAGLPPEYHFVEVMCCPGGCLGGGGQPKPTNMDIKKKRGMLIYQEAEKLPLHRSHDNPRIKDVYENFLGEVGGHRAHKLLHTHYHERHAQTDEMLESPECKAVQQQVLEGKRRTQKRITNVFSEVVDKFGYISDEAVVALAHHAKTTPVHIDSILSHYHYFPRHETPKSMIYLCECPTCRLNRSGDLKQHLKEQKIPFHMTSWLGWCVNGSPAALVKHHGDPQVHALLDIKPHDKRLSNLSAINNPFPTLMYDTLLSHRRYANAASVLADTSVANAEQLARDLSKKAWQDMTPEAIIEEIKQAGLRGCGGAGFPSHIKWTGVRKEAEVPQGKWVVINADEGLPSTFKDYHLMQDPALRMRMMTGIAIAANTVGARHSLLYLRYEYKNLEPLLMETFKRYKELNPLLNPQFTFEVVLGGGPYVCGEETALFESVEGHLPQARVERAVFPTHYGVFGAPTLATNVETISWVTQIVQLGAKAFNGVQTSPDQVGVKLLSISGDIPRPVLGEFPMGVTAQAILEEVAGVPLNEIAAVEVGGILEPLTYPKEFGKILSLDNKPDHLPAGGSVVVYRKDRFNERYIYQAKAKFGNIESCQLCVPCREGSAAFRHSVRSMFDGHLLDPSNSALKQRLSELTTAMEHSSNCGHGKACGKLGRMMMDKLGEKHDDNVFC